MKKGRPPGANSFTQITLEELRHYAGDKSLIPVSRVWLESMSANFKEIEEISEKARQDVMPKIEFKVTKFNDTKA